MEILSSVLIYEGLNYKSKLQDLIFNEFPQINLLGTASCLDRGKELIDHAKPDVIFFDIANPIPTDYNSNQCLEHFNSQVLIISNLLECGIDFLQKPLSISELQKLVKKLTDLKNLREKKYLNPLHDKLLLPHINGFSVVDVKCITKLVANSNYTKVFFSNNKSITVSKTLKEFESLLPENCFVRVHRSDMINIDFINEYNSSDGGYAVMKDGTIVPIAKNKAHELIDRIKNHSNVT